MYLSIISRSLIAKNPRVMLSTFKQAFGPQIDGMEAWVNKETERMNVMETYQRAVVDSIYLMGIVKIALATPAEAAMRAWGLRAGLPFMATVDFDDFVYDTRATRLDECGFVGHRIVVPLDAVKDSKHYSKARKKLEPSQMRTTNETGDERLRVIGSGVNYLDEDFQDMVELWEIYLPRERLIVTLPDDYMVGASAADSDGNKAEPLAEQPWIGSDSGPFVYLVHETVPQSALPKGPIQNMVDLHEAANRVFRKMLNQAERQKDNIFVSGQAENDAKRVMEVSDGDVLKVDHADQIKQTSLGGANNLNQQFFLLCKDLFSWAGGNLEALGGLAPQAKTLGQDKMLSQSSSQQISEMQDRTLKFVTDCTKCLCWYYLRDPYTVQRSIHTQMPGVSIEKVFTPEQRRGLEFEDLDIRIDPYSLKHTTPAEKQQQLTQIVNQTIVPMMPLLQAAGAQFDVQAYLKKMAELLDLPDLPEIITIGEVQSPEGTQAGVSSQGPRMPTQTERTYNRVSVPGRTEKGDMLNRMNALQGINPGGNPATTRNGVPPQ